MPLRVAILGATGVAGQQFMAALAAHPDFRVVRLGASSRRAGKAYGAAISDGGRSHWLGREPLDPALAQLAVEDVAAMDAQGIDVVFSALEAEAARAAEPRFAAAVPVLSTASAFRYDDDVPILLPGVSLEHAALLERQRRQRGWRGFIAPGPNCTAVGLAMVLKPLDTAFGVERVVMVSLQSVSGAGRAPGVAALDVIDNVVPYIAKEEEKVERETRRLLGRLEENGIAPASFALSCTCTRVPVLDGHTEVVSVGLARAASLEEIRRVLTEHGQDFCRLGLRSSPPRMIVVRDEIDRPQPRLDRDEGGGMTTVVGRLRQETALGGAGVKLVLVSHNTQLGAAKGAILTAEYLRQTGHIAG